MHSQSKIHLQNLEIYMCAYTHQIIYFMYVHNNTDLLEILAYLFENITKVESIDLAHTTQFQDGVLKSAQILIHLFACIKLF